MRIGADQILGQAVEIHAFPQGTWSIVLETEDGVGQGIGSGDTLAQAKTRARTALAKKRVRVAVPFFTSDNKAGVARGFHARNRTILVEIEGVKGESEGYGDNLRVDTPPEVRDRLAEIGRLQNELAAERRTLLKPWKIDLRTKVREAIEQATKQEVA